jgi:chromosomal replication initiation ATPase DnaA
MNPTIIPGITFKGFSPIVSKCILRAAKLYNLEPDHLFEKTQTQWICEARQYAMYLLRNNAGLTFEQIGKIFGKGHDTVIHSCKKIKWYKENNQLLIST